MRFDVISIFPDIIEAYCKVGVIGQALDRRLWGLRTWNPRQFADDKRQTIDAKPFGGGAGMVMMATPLAKTISAIKDARFQEGIEEKTAVIYLSPQGKRLTQEKVRHLVLTGGAILLCGRYEGIDERLIQHYVDEELSLGDFVLSGGEVAAMALIDASIRLLPHTLGNKDSAHYESFEQNYLDWPQYTEPRVFESTAVPDILLSGHHENIYRWRIKQAIIQTLKKRPDILDYSSLNKTEQSILIEIKKELEG